MAILAGIVGATVCFFVSEHINHHTNLDDACDTFGVHGMAGFCGTIFVGALADPYECHDIKKAPEWCANPGTVTRSWWQFWIQIVCAFSAAGYSVIVTYLMTKLMYCCCFRVLTHLARSRDLPRCASTWRELLCDWCA